MESSMYKLLFYVLVVSSCEEVKHDTKVLPMQLTAACLASNEQACIESYKLTCLKGKLRSKVQEDHPTDPKEKRLIMVYDCYEVNQ